jgi:HEAT repeat protein
LKPSENLKSILLQLQSSDESDRRNALLELIRCRDPRRDLILQKLAADDPSVELRYYARKALSSLQGPGSASPSPPLSPLSSSLRDLLLSGDLRQRLLGLKKAGEMPSRETAVLVRAGLEIEDNPLVRSAFIATLGQMGTSEDVPLLISFLNEADSRVRANAVEALGQIGGKEAMHHLVPLIKDPDNRVRTNAITVLHASGTIDLIDLLDEMTTSDAVWMRDSALFALFHFGDPRAHRILRHVADRDPLERLRHKARHYLSRLLSDSVAAKPAEAATVDGGETPPENALVVSRYAFLVQLLAPQRRISLLKLENLGKEDETALWEMLSKEDDSYNLALILSYLKKIGSAEHCERLLPFLRSADDRVRANAVEAVATIAPEAIQGHLVALVDDPHNRVRANAISALMRNLAFDPFPGLKSLAGDSREVYRRSALFVLSLSPRREFLPLLERLLDDPRIKVRDFAFEILEDYVRAGIAGAMDLRARISSRIGIEFFREAFFENAFDLLFSRFLAQDRREARGIHDLKDIHAAQTEHLTLFSLGEKLREWPQFPMSTKDELDRVEQEIRKIQEELHRLPRQEPTTSELPPETTAHFSDAEILQLEQRKLSLRREMLLANGASELLSDLSRLSTEQQSPLQPELNTLLNSRTFHIPPVETSLLPGMNAGLSDIFDLTIRVYQKHVLAFSLVSVLGAVSYLVLGLFFFGIFHWLRSWSPSWGYASLLALVPLAFSSFLVTGGTLKILFTQMMRSFIVGNNPAYADILRLAIEQRGLFRIQARKYLVLSFWVLGGVAAGFAVLIYGGTLLRHLMGPIRFSKAIVELAALLVFSACTLPPFARYLLVEPLCIIRGHQKAFDPLSESARLAAPHTLRLMGLYGVSFLLTVVIGQTTHEMLFLFKLFPRGEWLGSLFPLFSEICLFPLVYANIILFALMLLRHDATRCFVEQDRQDGSGNETAEVAVESNL